MSDEEKEEPIPEEVIITFDPEELAKALSEGRETVEREMEEESD